MNIINPLALGPNSITNIMVQALGRFHIFTSDGNFTAPKAGDYLVFGCGGGGGGGAGGGTIASFADHAEGAQGGQAGQFEFTICTLALNQVVAAHIGAGGDGGVGNAGLAGGDGSDGGATSFGGFLSCNGGQKGKGAILSDNASFYVGYGRDGGGFCGGRGGIVHAGSAGANPGVIGQSFGSGGGGGGGATSDGATSIAGGNGGAGQSGFIIVIW